jgi:hypothetical protein
MSSYYNLLASKKRATFPPSLLLDLFPNASVAYSLRKLRTAYSGNAIRVRRSSDNAEQDIGFVGNNLDTASLLTFCGAGNGFVTTWYDQSGNARNATQTTAINQPRIVNAGVLDTFNSKPAIINPNANVVRRLISSLSYVQNLPVTAILTAKINVLPTNGFGNVCFPLAGIVASGGGSRYELLASTSGFGAYRRDATSITMSSFNTNPFIQQGIFRASQLEGRFNGVDSTPASYSGTPFTTLGTFQLFGGGGVNTIFYANLYISECVIYLSDQYNNRVGIESNINSFYTIY